MNSLQSIYNNATITPKIRHNIKRYGTIYYIKIVTPDITVYKIGYTTQTVVERCYSYGLPTDHVIYLIAKLTCVPKEEVYSFEQILHTRYRNIYDSYCGKTILKRGGDSELYRWDVLGLDNNTSERMLFGRKRYR